MVYASGDGMEPEYSGSLLGEICGSPVYAVRRVLLGGDGLCPSDSACHGPRAYADAIEGEDRRDSLHELGGLVSITSCLSWCGKLSILMCFTSSAGCTSIMRAITVPTLNGSDYSYQSGQLFIWTGAELATTIVAASIPILRALVSELRTGRNSENTELNTFKSMGERGGIQVTRTTIITRTASKAERARKMQDDEDGLLTPLTPMTPVPTYHSYVQT